MKSGRRVLFSLFLRVRFVSLSLFILPAAAETKCERNSEAFSFSHILYRGDSDDDDAFADDDFLALLWKKRNNATVVRVHVEIIVKALLVFFFFFIIIPFSF